MLMLGLLALQCPSGMLAAVCSICFGYPALALLRAYAMVVSWVCSSLTPVRSEACRDACTPGCGRRVRRGHGRARRDSEPQERLPTSATQRANSSLSASISLFFRRSHRAVASLWPSLWPGGSLPCSAKGDHKPSSLPSSRPRARQIPYFLVWGTMAWFRFGGGSLAATLAWDRAPSPAGIRIGEASNPGPIVTVSSINVSSYLKNHELVASVGADLLALQEHVVPQHMEARAKGVAGSAKYAWHGSHACDKTALPSAGVSLMAKRPMAIFTPRPKSQAFLSFEALGRLTMAVVALGPSMPCLVMSMYGYVKDDYKRKCIATSELFEAAVQEARLWPKLPMLICADLNADPLAVQSVRYEIEHQHLFDIGSLASVWGESIANPRLRPMGPNAPHALISCSVTPI